MKKLLLTAFAIFYLINIAFSQDKKIPVFLSGEDNYETFRIPAIIRLPNGNLLAFAEGRVNGMADFGHINIVMKKSMDDGKTWYPLKVVAENDSLQAGNPAPVVDLTDPAYPHGRIFLFYNTGNKSESQIRKGIGSREVWYTTSVDNGATWSSPINITSQVKKENWRSYANTPGHAIQFSYGKYKGRIYVAANHSAGDPQPHFQDYRTHGFYTDDHGKTFHLSEDVNMPGGNEVSAAALNNNQLMLNIRNQKQAPRCRIVAVSSNGGAHWDTACYDYHLPDPACEGSLLNIGEKNNKTVLAFCNNADTLRRDNLTLRISCDNGKSWKKNFLIEQKNTGYSDIVKMNKNKIGILYEADDYKKILFTIAKWK